MNVFDLINKSEYNRLINDGFTHLEALQTIFEEVRSCLEEELQLCDRCGDRWGEKTLQMDYEITCAIQDIQGSYLAAFEAPADELEASRQRFLKILEERENIPPLPPNC